MEDTIAPTEQPTFSPEDRIRQLNNIDKLVADMVESAGKAVQALANADPNASTLEEHQTIFSDAVSKYFTLLSTVDVQLRRQIYALQEAGLVSDASTQDSQGALGSGAVRDQNSTMPIRDLLGETSPLDISWLNSRNDSVGRAIRQELWKELEHALDEGRSTDS
ncbi:MAG: hypothetical protein Q9160_002022 [Pyrenula sp. 1 TL-2023]